MPRDKRQKRDLHALDGDGTVMCNPRDKEAAHRAQTERIATGNWAAVTCPKCISLIYKRNEALRGGKYRAGFIGIDKYFDIPLRHLRTKA